MNNKKPWATVNLKTSEIHSYRNEYRNYDWLFPVFWDFVLLTYIPVYLCFYGFYEFKYLYNIIYIDVDNECKGKHNNGHTWTYRGGDLIVYNLAKSSTVKKKKKAKAMFCKYKRATMPFKCLWRVCVIRQVEKASHHLTICTSNLDFFPHLAIPH